MGWLPGYPGAYQEHRWQTSFVQNPVNRLDAVFPMAAAVALDLIQQGEVRDQWVMPSVLPKMSIGALACHLGRQVVRAAEVLPTATDVLPLESADAHYHRAAWVMSTSPDDPPNDRSTDDAEAALGAAALAGQSARAMETVRRLLAAGAVRDVVLIPWQGWALRRDDFLLTRMLEIVVHADDLALSAGVRTPEFPAEVFAPVRDLLVRLAVKRHGQSAVISALARSERTQTISAF
jgi:Mycothiol maleylpyruvate isomerase N-terminal domain